jgi:phenylacetic acid degradation protein paaN
MILFEKHRKTLEDAIAATRKRTYFTPYPEGPRAYPDDLDEKAKVWMSGIMNSNFSGLKQGEPDFWIGEEVSPFLQVGTGVRYPAFSIPRLLHKATLSQKQWSNVSIEERTGILIETLSRISLRFFDIAYATMHCAGQSFMMSFQASGPHANDRALEVVAMGYEELTRFPKEVDWIKSFGKFDLKLHKDWKTIGRGTGLVIGCSTFPVWNTVPGLYATLITGNSCIVKPHPKAVLPIAIVIEEIQKTLFESGLDPFIVQLAVDSSASPITKQLAESPSIKMIDFTGGSEFGDYIEHLPKVTFTEKAGVNSIIVDSVTDLNAVWGNIAFSASLYSGQMCTAPQNIFVSKNGVSTSQGLVSYDDFVQGFSLAISGLVNNPKAGPGTLGAIQSDATFNRVKDISTKAGHAALASRSIKNEEFVDARIATPVVISLDKSQIEIYGNECFGPIVYIIKTDGLDDSIAIAKSLAEQKGALTCGAYATSESNIQKIAVEMNAAFVPVSFNFTGAAFINSHAAFSDFHLTGGNPAGNASFTNPEFVTKRFVWVGNRYMS